ncbi:hypothetical protein Tco_0748740 [Tanacetum coccineum]|uniref:Uncharacterized protein n=1 Tax=Tanacetum coccineum TaxID=301880 RepID=A0ABQ4YWH4_9ASTR
MEDLRKIPDNWDVLKFLFIGFHAREVLQVFFGSLSMNLVYVAIRQGNLVIDSALGFDNQYIPIIASKLPLRKDYCSDNQYAVSIKEDTSESVPAHSTKGHKGNKIQTPIQRGNMRIQQYGNKIFLKLQTGGPYSEKPPIRRI